MEYSTYQTAIFEWIRTGRGHATANAVAGSGKTFSLVAACEHITGKALFCAFNKHIEQELAKRLPRHVTVKTIHSLGFGLLRDRLGRKIRVDDRKAWELTEQPARDLERQFLRLAREGRGIEAPEFAEIAGWLRKLIHFARVTLTPAAPEALAEMADCYGIDIEAEPVVFDAVIATVPALLERSAEVADRQNWIDYDDMIWLPCHWDLVGVTFDWVLVDEAQDLSNAQRAIVERHIGAGGRSLWVGDPAQSIQGFAGADPESFDRIREQFYTTDLPLSICYRCPPDHLELAREIVPQIEPAPGREPGVLQSIDQAAIVGMVQEGDMILSRWTAPAVALCLELIAARIPARVKGRDIGKGLAQTVQEIADQPGFQWSVFGRFALLLLEAKQQKILARKGDHESQINALEDRFTAIDTCRLAFKAKSADELARSILDLFADERRAVTLSTIHRSKGLEADRVFILDYPKLPVRWKRQQDWEAWQEECCQYVALTRSKRELYLVSRSKEKE